MSELDLSSGHILARWDACEGCGRRMMLGDDGASAQNGIAGKTPALSHGRFV
jgi:hypothetical protein